MRHPAESYSGYRRMKYLWMQENCPKELERLDASGELEAYLGKVEQECRSRHAELVDLLYKRNGVSSTYLVEHGYLANLQLATRLHMEAQQMAIREVIGE